jgi:predicted phage tail protein
VQSANRLGEKQSLQSGEYVSVNQSGTISKPQRLLDVPQPLQPRDLERFSVTNGSATVTLRWQKAPSGMPAYYRVEVATSPFFVPEGRVMERDQLSATQFDASDLRPGSYFWRVRATAASGQTSDWSEPLKFIVTATGANQSAVHLLNLAAVHLGGDVYIIRGIANPGANIRVSDREVTAAANGAFQIQISAPPNAREVMIQVSDSQGNTGQYRLSLASSS